MKMFRYIIKLDTLGFEIDDNSKIDAILSSLHDSFNQFVLNFNMTNMTITFSKLHNMLLEVEDLIKKDKLIVMVSKNKVFSKSKKRKFASK